MGWGDVALQTAAILAPVSGAVWQVYSGRRSTHAAEIAQIEAAISTAADRDPVLAKAYRAHALKRLSDFHGRPGNAGVALLLWATVALGILALIPGATGWPALLLMASFVLSLGLAGSNYSKLEYRHQVRDHETKAALERALIHSREELMEQVDESAPTASRTSLAHDAAAAIKTWSRQRKVLIVFFGALVVASIGASRWLATALQERSVGLDQTLTWTAWMLCIALVVYISAILFVTDLLARLASGLLLRLLRIFVPVAIAAATFTWVPMPLAQYLRQLLLDDPTATWTSVAAMVVVLHDVALVAFLGPIAVEAVRRLRDKRGLTGAPQPGADREAP